MNSIRALTGVLCAAAVVAIDRPVAAGYIEFKLNTEFSGAQEPMGPPPWIIAKFEDTDTDEVTLTLTSGLIDSEKMVEFYFNVDPTLDLSGISIMHSSGVTGLATLDSNNLKADGDGYFDGLISFSPSSPLFGPSSTSTWVITGAGLNVETFDFLSSSKKLEDKNDGLSVAAHILGLDDPEKPGVDTDGSGWITNGPGGTEIVPEPSSVILLGMGGLSLLGYGWRRRKTNVAA